MQVTRENRLSVSFYLQLAVGEKGHSPFEIQELPDIIAGMRDSALKLHQEQKKS